jgi:hypothetical protein
MGEEVCVFPGVLSFRGSSFPGVGVDMSTVVHASRDDLVSGVVVGPYGLTCCAWCRPQEAVAPCLRCTTALLVEQRDGDLPPGITRPCHPAPAPIEGDLS